MVFACGPEARSASKPYCCGRTCVKILKMLFVDVTVGDGFASVLSPKDFQLQQLLEDESLLSDVHVLRQWLLHPTRKIENECAQGQWKGQ